MYRCLYIDVGKLNIIASTLESDSIQFVIEINKFKKNLKHKNFWVLKFLTFLKLLKKVLTKVFLYNDKNL